MKHRAMVRSFAVRKSEAHQSLLGHRRRSGLFRKNKGVRLEEEEEEEVERDGNFRTPEKQQQNENAANASSSATPPISPESTDDDKSNVSDLTADYDGTTVDPPGRMLRVRSGESPVLIMQAKLQARNEVGVVPEANTKLDPEPSTSIVQNILCMVDKACASTAVSSLQDPAAHPTGGIRQMLSFSPEWGLAPSKDELDAGNKKASMDQPPRLPNKGFSPVNSLGPEKPPQPPSPHKHENFELILQENNLMSASLRSPETTTARMDSETQKMTGRAKKTPKKKLMELVGFIKRDGSTGRNTGVPIQEISTGTPKWESSTPAQDEDFVYPTPPQPKQAPPLASRRSNKSHKEARYKHLLGNLMHKFPLETVREENEEVNEATELKVRVPGLRRHPDMFISGKDLLHDDFDDNWLEGDFKEGEEKDGETFVKTIPQRSMNRRQQSSDTRSELERISEDPPTPIRRSRTWIESWGLTRACDDPSVAESKSIDTLLDAIPLTRQLSAPELERKDSAGSLSPIRPDPTTKPGPLWKKAVDPTSGKTYYYHRITRKSTWTKPPDADLIPSKEVVQDEDVKFSLDALEGDAQGLLRKRSHRDFDPQVWKMKQEIAKIIKTMTPPDASSVEKLLNQYEGKESELLTQLRDLTESQPFDEPKSNPSSPVSNPSPLSSSNEMPPPAERFKDRVRTQTSLVSGHSSAMMSASTQPVKNTGRGKPNFVRKGENESYATSISSKHGMNLPRGGGALLSGRRMRSRVPSNVPVPRTRELMVEDFSSDRIKSKGVVRVTPATPPAKSGADRDADFPDVTPYHGDAEDAVSKDTESVSIPNDSISALSETDVSFMERKDAYDAARRRALNEAIAMEDWDLAAALSEGMRTLKVKEGLEKEKLGAWKQTEIDRFISKNDWDAVAGYIAQVRSQAKYDSKESSREENPTREFAREVGGHDARAPRKHNVQGYKPQKRFGAKSQLQHRRSSNSVDSWDSRSESSYESESCSTSSYDEPVRRQRGRKGMKR